MACIVQKYGGSSVVDIQKIKKIAEMISQRKEHGDDIAVVVSAMGKTTNKLIGMAHEISKTPSRREMDMLLSTGERITMSLLCMALNEQGIDAVSLTGSQSGIITNDRHNDAQVIEVRPFRVLDELAKGKVVVIGGFQGVSYKRDITTLGRGGSDTTAVALAAALEATQCEIYSDVPGIYSADPATVEDACHLPEISYPIMQEMSAAGAKVLNAHAVQFAKEKQIAIYTRSTFMPGKETIIRRLPPGKLFGVQAVVSEKAVTRIRINQSDAYEQFEWIIKYLENEQVPIKELNLTHIKPQHKNSKVSFVVSSPSIYRWDAIKVKIETHFEEKVEFDDHLATLSLIGEGLNHTNKVLIQTMELLKENNIEIEGLTTTSFRISILIPQNKIETAVKLCHKKWINGQKIPGKNI
jgi:aspartate kinase